MKKSRPAKILSFSIPCESLISSLTIICTRISSSTCWPRKQSFFHPKKQTKWSNSIILMELTRSICARFIVVSLSLTRELGEEISSLGGGLNRWIFILNLYKIIFTVFQYWFWIFLDDEFRQQMDLYEDVLFEWIHE
jgi:hypothetical protein